MGKYRVVAGQNIYDVALYLYGSIEGVVDLLINNPDLSFATTLTAGRELVYTDDFVIRHVKTLLNPQGADETRRRYAQRLVRHQRQRRLGPLCRAEQYLFNHVRTRVCIHPNGHASSCYLQ